jgi:hypothetical protein
VPCRIEQIAVSKEHGALPSRLHQQGRGTNRLQVRFDDKPGDEPATPPGARARRDARRKPTMIVMLDPGPVGGGLVVGVTAASFAVTSATAVRMDDLSTVVLSAAGSVSPTRGPAPEPVHV